MRRALTISVALAGAWSSVTLAQTRTPKSPRDTATSAFAWRITRLADSAAMALEFITDSTAAQFVDVVNVGKVDRMLGSSGAVPASSIPRLPYSFIALVARATNASETAAPLIDAFEAYDAPAGLGHMQEEMSVPLRGAAAAATSVSRNAFPCQVSTELCRDSLPVALAALRTQMELYYAARLRTLAMLGERTAAPPR